MNVYKCSGQSNKNMQCVYAHMSVDEETGDIRHDKCAICQQDQYNIYPEHDPSSGEVIYQTSMKDKDGKPLFSTEVDPLGPVIIWENITGMHQHGLSFDYRNFSPYEHPRYYIKEHIVPTKCGMLDPDSIADVFGDEHITMVSPGWNDDKSYGKPTVEKCTQGLFGKFNRSAGIVLHRSMKSYISDILGWTNYTKYQERVVPKLLYLMEASDELIEVYCRDRFPENIIDRMAEIMRAVRDGEYINLRKAAINNGMTEEASTQMIQEISLKSKSMIYKGTVNLQKICELYERIPLLIKDPSFITMYRVNIINYLLNFDKLKNTVLAYEKFSTSERYWFVYLVMKKAYERDKILDNNKVPYWLVRQIEVAKRREIIFPLLGNVYSAIPQKSNSAFDIFAEAQFYNLRRPEQLYPAMGTLEDILKEEGYKKASKKKKSTFANILKAGIKWNIAEIQTVWDVFNNCYDTDRPHVFWNFINDLDELDYSELEKRITGDGNPGLKKVCFANLVEARIPFKNQSNWEVEIPVAMSSVKAGAKHKAKFKSYPQHFWVALMQMGGLKEDDYHNLDRLSTNQVEQMLIKEEMEEDFIAPDTEQVFDADEFDSFSVYDPKTGSYTPMVRRGTNEENWTEGELDG